LGNDNWTILFTWVKAHKDNYGNELADQLAKEAVSRSEAEIAYNKILFLLNKRNGVRNTYVYLLRN